LEGLVFTLVAVVVPLALAVAVQKLGERLGWSARAIFGAGVVVMWLWYTVAWATGARLWNPIGVVVIGLMVGTTFLVIWLVFTWAGRDIIDRYEEYLTSKRRPSGSD